MTPKICICVHKVNWSFIGKWTNNTGVKLVEKVEKVEKSRKFYFYKIESKKWKKWEKKWKI